MKSVGQRALQMKSTTTTTLMHLKLKKKNEKRRKSIRVQSLLKFLLPNVYYCRIHMEITRKFVSDKVFILTDICMPQTGYVIHTRFDVFFLVLNHKMP